jgi:hypothetical protein
MMEIELDAIRQHNPNVTPRELKLIEESLRATTGKIAHDVILAIRKCAQDGSLESQMQLEGIRAVFASHSEPLPTHTSSDSVVASYEAKLTRLRSDILAQKDI